MKKFTLIILGVFLLIATVYCCEDSTAKIKLPNPSILPNSPQIIIPITNIKPFSVFSNDNVERNPEAKIINTPQDIVRHPENKVQYNDTKLYTNPTTDVNQIIQPPSIPLISKPIQKESLKTQDIPLLTPLASQPPVSQPPVSQPPVSQPLASQPPVSQPLASQPPVSQPPVSQPPVSQPPVSQSPVSQLSNESPQEYEAPFNVRPINDYSVPQRSYEDKYWNIVNGKFILLENSPLQNTRYFNGINESPSRTIDVKSSAISMIESEMSEFPPKMLRYQGEDYNIFGLASNKYYNIRFIVYEKEVEFNEPNTMPGNNKYYSYLLAKKVDNKLQIMNLMQPRNRISMGEYVSFTFGVSQLNFLLITPI